MKYKNAQRTLQDPAWRTRVLATTLALVVGGVGIGRAVGQESGDSASNGRQLAPAGVEITEFNFSEEHPDFLDAMLKLPGGIPKKPVITSFETGEEITIEWTGFAAPYQVERSTLLSNDWEPVGDETDSQSLSFLNEGSQSLGFFRVDGRAPNFAGAETCMSCHDEKHANWSETPHAHAMESLEKIGQAQNSHCVVCHSVGHGLETGFKDMQSTPGLAGVQCESCHGPAAEHAADPGDPTKRPLIEMASEMCGSCHNGPHHAMYEEWNLAKHSVATPSLQANSHSRESCLECHSQDYRYKQEHGLETPSVANAKLSIECSTCHEPHGGVEQDYQLRKPTAMLCGQCHTTGESTLGDTPHHPQFEILKGESGFQADGSDLENSHAHSSLAQGTGEACAQCHVVKHEVEEPTEGNPVVTGHTFNPFDESIKQHQASQYTGCQKCHSDAVADALRTSLQSSVSDRLAQLAPFFDSGSDQYIDPSSLNSEEKERLQAAEFNFKLIEADGSLGVHNPKHARAALDVAEKVVEELTGSSISQTALSSR